MVAIEAGEKTAASRVADGAADSEAAEELEQGTASGGTMFGSIFERERRPLWAILSCLFVLGFVVSTLMVRSERNGALESVAKLARDDAQLLTVILTDKQLTHPVTGSSYDKLAGRIGKSLSSKASIVGVTVWSSQGQILFSLNESLVGTTPPDMQPLIVGIAQGPGGTRVLDDTVQTFLPVSRATGGPVAVVQLDQPFAFAETRIGGYRSMVRMGFGLALAVSLLLFGLTFVSSRSLRRAPEDDEGQAEADEGAEVEATDTEAEGADTEAEEQPADRLARELQTLRSDLDLTVDQDTDQPVDEDKDQAVDRDSDLAAYFESQEAMRQRRDELKARAKEAELRVKKLEAELHPAPSAPKSEQ
jgi:hypothetical protein